MPAYTPPPEDYPPLSEPMAPLYGWEMEAEVDPLPQVSTFFTPVVNFRAYMFLGDSVPDPDPDPLVRGRDPDPSIIKRKTKIVTKTLFCDFCVAFYL